MSALIVIATENAKGTKNFPKKLLFSALRVLGCLALVRIFSFVFGVLCF